MPILHGLTKEMVPLAPTQKALLPQCEEHPDAPWDLGFGYDGGGFGHYRKCRECGQVFAKRDIGDK